MTLSEIEISNFRGLYIALTPLEFAINHGHESMEVDSDGVVKFFIEDCDDENHTLEQRLELERKREEEDRKFRHGLKNLIL